jgi:hypothetical protein
MGKKAEELAARYLMPAFPDYRDTAPIGGQQIRALAAVLERYGEMVREAAAKLPDDHAKALRAEAERETDPQQAIDDGLDAVSFSWCAKAIREMPLP